MIINSVNNLSFLQGAGKNPIVVSPLRLQELKEAVDKFYKNPKLRNSNLFFNDEGKLDAYDAKIPELKLQDIPLKVKALKTALYHLTEFFPDRTYQKPSFEEFTPLNNPPAVRIKLPSIMCQPPINYEIWQDTGKPMGIHKMQMHA